MSPTRNSSLATPLKRLFGVGSEREAQLARLKLVTVGDLLLHRPRRYEDRRHFRRIADLQLGEAATVRGTVVAMGLKRYRRGAKSVFELVVDDGTARLHCRWWNLPFMEKYFRQGNEVFVFGKPIHVKPRTIDHPETEVIESDQESSIHINRITSIYPLTEGLPQRWLRSLVWRALNQFEKEIAEPWPSLALSDLPSRANAIRTIHFPAEISDVEGARRRLALDEFIELQLGIQRRRKTLLSHASGLPCAGDNHLNRPFLKQFGSELTDAQKRVLCELRRDLGSGQPMRRLLQGDVGSGKTVVAACCALMAIESGFNVVLMAPTEILAEQHYRTFGGWFESLDVPVQLQTGSRKTASALANGPGLAFDTQRGTGDTQRPSLFIGTHALIEDAFTIEHLGLVIIDEQHKFGVAQREKLVRKGHYPHLLVMTATPIPRTLGLTLYSDLDISTIDELPPGRGRIRTFVRSSPQLPKVWEFVQAKLAEGRQAYVVYPRVEDSGKGEIKAVTQDFERLRKTILPFRLELVHGRLPADEAQRVMERFRQREIHVLLTTSVIEVGVNVPNATVMLIENAEQFGLAQLHQLRGRIGRGAHESFCILVSELKSEEAVQRLRILEETTDGFKIAEADLKSRGPGELLGSAQSGFPSFRFADLVHDFELLKRARALAARILENSTSPA